MEIGLGWIIIIAVVLMLDTVIAFSNFFRIGINITNILKNKIAILKNKNKIDENK